MDVPGIVREHLDDEQRMTSVNVGGDDRIYVTPPRTLVYHASGLFSRESIDEYSHDARRFDVSADRREATFAFEYGDGVKAFSVPAGRIETVLPPVLKGVLRTTGLIEDDESVEESYRFGERTLVVTDRRLLTSVGEAVWERDHERYDYETVTGLDFAEGGLILEIDGESRRVELGDGDGREAYETVATALCDYHGVANVEELPSSPPGPSGPSRTEPRRPVDGEDSVAWEASPENIESTTGTHDRKRTNETDEPEPTTTATPSSPAPASEPTDFRLPDAAAEPDDLAGPGETEAPNSAFDEPAAADEPTATGEPTASRSGDVAGANPAPIDADEPIPSAEPDSSDPADEPDTSDLTEEVAALRGSIERHAELLERNQELLERLIETRTERVNDDQ